MRNKLASIFLSAALAASCLFPLMPAGSSTASASTRQTLSPYTGTTYTHSGTFDDLNIYNGIDVSKYNTTVDWEKVKADGIDFVFIRLGYRGYGSLGKLCADVSFESHISGALAAGLKVGVYYFTQAVNTSEAIEEANYCIEKLQDYDITLPVVLDYEFPNTGNGYTGGRMYDAKLSKSAATKNCQAFCDTIKDAGYTPMIYANKSDLTTVINGTSLGKSYKIWLANYTSKTTYTGAYDFWQYTEKGKVNGISGNVDCNYWYSSDNTGTVIPPENATSISKAKFDSIPAAIYTGKNIIPTPAVTLDGKKLILNEDYVLSYRDNQNIGQATITATGIGNYKGTKSKTFKIRPQKVTAFKKKSAKASITLTWAEHPKATGYQIYRKDTYSATDYVKVKTFKKSSKIKWTNADLQADHEYFYRIRAYTKVNGTNYYSDYTYLTAATLPGSKKATVNKKTKLYEHPDLNGKSIITIPKSANVTYLGCTYLTEEQKAFHIKYTVNEKNYSGYIPTTIKLTF